MSYFDNPQLEQDASNWALEQIKSETDPVEAAKKFFSLRKTFIDAYNTEKSKSK